MPLGGKLQDLPDVGIGYQRTIKYSPAGAVDTMNTGQELLRLSPPSPGDGPVIQLSLGPLLVAPARGSSGTGDRAADGAFPKKVHVEGAVLDALDFDANKRRRSRAR
jgi:hypothetical protein